MLATERRLLWGSAASSFGSWIDFIAILTLASTHHHAGPYDMALLGAAGLLPGIIAAKRLGRLCDGPHHSQVLRIALAVRIVATVALCFAPNLMVIVCLSAVRSAANAATPIAINVIAVKALSALQIRMFYAQQSVLSNCAKVLSPSIGAGLTFLAGESGALAMAAGMTAVALGFFSTLPNAIMSKAHAEKPLAERFGGNSVVNCTSILTVVLIYFSSVFLVNNQLPLILHKSGFEPALFGVLVSCSGAGNILSGLWLSRAAKHEQIMNTSALTRPGMVQASGLLLLGLLITQNNWAAVAMPITFFVMGMSSARFAVMCSWLIAHRYPDSVGLASALIQKWQNIAMLAAPLVGAVIFDMAGGSALLLAAGATGLVALGVSRIFLR